MTARKRTNRLQLGQMFSGLLESYVLIPLFAISMLAVIWFATMYLIRTEHEAVERQAADSARELIESYDAQMIRNLASINQTLKTVVYVHELNGGPATLTDLEKKGLLPHKLVFTVSIANHRGQIVASTSPDSVVNISEQPYFHRHESHDSGELQVNLINSSTSDPRIQFSRRLNAKNGSFNGIAIVAVAPDYFTSGYERSRLGDSGALGLIGADGVFLARRTGDQVRVGEPAFKTMTGFDMSAESEEGLPDVHFVDGVQRYANSRKLYGYPLGIVVGLSTAEQFDSFEKQKKHYLWGATIISLLMVVIAAIVSRLLWQLAQSRKRTRKNQETHYAASEASNEGVYVLRAEIDHEGEIADFIVDDINNRGAELFGCSKTELLGARLCDRLPQCRNNGVLDELIHVFQQGGISESEWKTDSPLVKAEWLYRQVIRVEDGVVVVIRDISERKQIEERIIHMAHHDALTGLPNRSLLTDRIQQEILRARRHARRVTIAFVDLDRFKPINDTFGHRVGDAFLKVLADRMVNALRQTDTVVRLGGDEFVIIMGDQPADNAMLTLTLERIRSVIADPVHFEGNILQVTCSMGLARFPEDGEDWETLLRNADAAMYQAKSDGRNNYRYYEPGMIMRAADRDSGSGQVDKRT